MPSCSPPERDANCLQWVARLEGSCRDPSPGRTGPRPAATVPVGTREQDSQESDAPRRPGRIGRRRGGGRQAHGAPCAVAPQGTPRATHLGHARRSGRQRVLRVVAGSPLPGSAAPSARLCPVNDRQDRAGAWRPAERRFRPGAASSRGPPERDRYIFISQPDTTVTPEGNRSPGKAKPQTALVPAVLQQQTHRPLPQVSRVLLRRCQILQAETSLPAPERFTRTLNRWIPGETVAYRRSHTRPSPFRSRYQPYSGSMPLR
jgi:hypothetical protein